MSPNLKSRTVCLGRRYAGFLFDTAFLYNSFEQSSEITQSADSRCQGDAGKHRAVRETKNVWERLIRGMRIESFSGMWG